MQTASIIVYVYAMLVAAGGVIGYVKAKSPPSLVAGGVSSLLLLAAGYEIGSGRRWGLDLAVLLASFLTVFFGMRFVRSNLRAFMPGGLMAILSLLTLIGIALTAHSR